MKQFCNETPCQEQWCTDFRSTHLGSLPRARRPEQDCPDAVIALLAVLLGRCGSGGGRHRDAAAILLPSHETEVQWETTDKGHVSSFPTRYT